MKLVLAALQHGDAHAGNGQQRNHNTDHIAGVIGVVLNGDELLSATDLALVPLALIGDVDQLPLVIVDAQSLPDVLGDLSVAILGGNMLVVSTFVTDFDLESVDIQLVLRQHSVAQGVDVGDIGQITHEIAQGQLDAADFSGEAFQGVMHANHDHMSLGVHGMDITDQGIVGSQVLQVSESVSLGQLHNGSDLLNALAFQLGSQLILSLSNDLNDLFAEVGSPVAVAVGGNLIQSVLGESVGVEGQGDDGGVLQLSSVLIQVGAQLDSGLASAINSISVLISTVMMVVLLTVMG